MKRQTWLTERQRHEEEQRALELVRNTISSVLSDENAQPGEKIAAARLLFEMYSQSYEKFT